MKKNSKSLTSQKAEANPGEARRVVGVDLSDRSARYAVLEQGEEFVEESQLKLTEEDKRAWYRHWVTTGFSALERRLSTEEHTGKFSHGDAPGLADIVLVPQVANANRYKVDLEAFPVIRRINENCLALEAFRKAMPQNQPDAE